MLNIAFAILLYPGLLLACALTLLFRFLAEGLLPYEHSPRFPTLSLSSLSGLVSIILSTVALAALPWPFHPAADYGWVASPLVLWFCLEGAYMVPLVPGLLSRSPLASREVIREAQISIAGRFVLWLAIGVALWSGIGWDMLMLPARVLAALAGLLALPAAAGIGPFSAERSVSVGGAETGLDEATSDLLRFARTMRGAVLVATLVTASFPYNLLNPMAALLLSMLLFLIILVLLRRVALSLPRLPLPSALRWCWWRALPLAVAGLVYLILV